MSAIMKKCTACNRITVKVTYSDPYERICKACKADPFTTISLSKVRKIYGLTIDDLVQQKATKIGRLKYVVEDIEKIAFKVHNANPDEGKKMALLHQLESARKKRELNVYVRDTYCDSLSSVSIYFYSGFTGNLQNQFIHKVAAIVKSYADSDKTLTDSKDDILKIYEECKKIEDKKTSLKTNLNNFIANKFKTKEDLSKLCGLDIDTINKYLKNKLRTGKNIYETQNLVFSITNKYCTKQFWKIYECKNIYGCSDKISAIDNIWFLHKILEISSWYEKFINNVDPNVITENDIEKTDIIGNFCDIAKATIETIAKYEYKN